MVIERFVNLYTKVLERKIIKKLNNKISVIVPIYNAEAYLKQCFDSICNQTHKNLEIIFVNDCSTDDSYNICLEYAQKDERVTVVNKEINEGLGCARLSGLERATGEYIVWVDSDDWISADMFGDLLQLTTEYDADIVQCKTFLVYDKKVLQTKDTYEVSVFDNVFALKSLISLKKIDTVYWNKLFKRDLFNKVKVSSLKRSDDYDTMYRLIFESKHIIFIDKSYYFYRQLDNSMSAGSLSIERSVRLTKIAENRSDFIKEKVPELTDLCQRILFKMYVFNYISSNRNDDGSKEYLENLSLKIRRLYSDVAQSFSVKEQCLYFILMLASKRNTASRFLCFVMRKVLKMFGYRYSRMQKRWYPVKNIHIGGDV